MQNTLKTTTDAGAAAWLDALEDSPASYLKTARLLEAAPVPDLEPLKVAVLSTFTANPIRPYLIVEGARRGFLIQTWFGGYGQLEQEVIAPDSGLYAGAPDVIAIATRLEDLSPHLSQRFNSMSAAQIEGEIDAVAGRLGDIVKHIRAHSQAAILLFNHSEPVFLSAGIADFSLELPQSLAVARLNERLAAIARESADVCIFDQARLAQEVGLRRWYDPRLYCIGRIALSAEAQREVGRHLARSLRAIRKAPCKCIVLDLDNTLWGGVLGEDGPEGIATSDDYPGSAFRAFQRALLALRDRGILLAIASKNNESDVLEVFRQNRDLLIGLEDFAATQIHWMDKATSLTAIAKELNIGTDALVFFDDNPAERAWIRERMPEVTVIEVPSDPTRYVHALLDSGAFDTMRLSTEDRRRADLYMQEKQRQELMASAVTLDEFLKNLQITATIDAIGRASLPRVAQLIAKTNQFNLTTRRRSAADVTAILEAGGIGLHVRVEDRFGDHGLVGVAIAVPHEDDAWLIDVFLLSCRVIGRGVEGALLHALSRRVAERGGLTLIGEFIETAKNRPAAGFYEASGFTPLDDDSHRWSRNLRDAPIHPPDFIDIRIGDDDQQP